MVLPVRQNHRRNPFPRVDIKDAIPLDVEHPSSLSILRRSNASKPIPMPNPVALHPPPNLTRTGPPVPSPISASPVLLFRLIAGPSRPRFLFCAQSSPVNMFGAEPRDIGLVVRAVRAGPSGPVVGIGLGVVRGGEGSSVALVLLV